MKTRIRRIALWGISVVLATAASATLAAPLEAVTGLDVHNPGAFLASLDNYYETDAPEGSSVAIWSVSFSGESKVSHLAIANFADYDDFEETTNTRNASHSWLRFVSSVRDAIDVESRLMAIERYRQGSGWQNHGAMAAFVMTVTDPDAYVAAFAEFVEASDNPGSVRLMELRFGGQGATHAALISASGVAALNEYLDNLLSSDAYRTFAGKVSGIRTIQNVEMLRRVRTFSN